MYRLLLLGLLVALAGCEREESSLAEAKERFDTLKLMEQIGTLASDEFGGREPGSAGENRTVEYIAGEFARVGLSPGNGEEWFQAVPLVKITANPAMSMRILGGEQPLEFAFGTDMTAFSARTEPEILVENSELVFAGYGIVAPEYGWNDYEGLDVQGKTVVVLVNDPGFGSKDPELFNGEAMTYYGRWTYKYEEAARQGATGCIIIHETDAAGYPWEVVQSSWTGPQFDLPNVAGSYRLALQGWITGEAANRLFANTGLDLAQLKQQALQRNFRAVPLEQAVTININNTIEQIESRNVVGVLHGSARPDETIIFTAHWDHLGTDPSLPDPIYNGAVDNATGVAGLMALAEAFAQLDPPPERSIVFLAVTAEESGLLGSKWYAQNPIFPIERTVAAINMDSMNVYGPTSDVVVVGAGMSELEDILQRVAAEQGRTVVAEEHPERGYYYRSDHFNFAKVGVPALYAESGSSYVGENAGEARRRAEAYTANNYHKPSDEFEDWWNLGGMIQDLEMYFQIAEELANSEEFPNWREGTEFRAKRDESAQLRAVSD